MTTVFDDYDCKDHPLLDWLPNARRFATSGHNDRPIYDCVDAETLERAMSVMNVAIGLIRDMEERGYMTRDNLWYLGLRSKFEDADGRITATT